MKQQVVCPACNAPNKPKAVTCRVCGERLVARRETPNRKEPVVLQRVMTGEVFSAVVVPGEDRTHVRATQRSALDEKPPPGGESPTEGAGSLGDDDVARLLREILTLSQRGEFADAIARADRILRERSDDPKALIAKGDALFRAGRRKEASEIFDVLVNADPENAKLWLDRARIRKALEDYPEALKSYDTALAIRGDDADAWYERGVILDTLENAADALKSVARALELRPDSAPARTLKTDIERRLSRRAVEAVAQEIDREIAEIEERAQATAIRDAAAIPPPPGPEVLPPPPPAFREVSPPKPAPTAATRARPKGRLYTYVEGLDEALNGGIPEGHIVIVAGPPGTLKSSLCFSMAASNAARERRPCLYVTFEEGKESFLQQARSIGLPVEETAECLTLLDARDLQAAIPAGADWVDGFSAHLAALRKERPFDLLVLDSLEALEALGQIGDRRRAIFRLFEHLRTLGVTALVAAERPDVLINGNVVYGRWAEDFLADGILHLRQHFVSDVEVQRRVRIVKMRGTRHETGYLALLVDDGRLRATRAMAQ